MVSRCTCLLARWIFVRILAILPVRSTQVSLSLELNHLILSNIQTLICFCLFTLYGFSNPSLINCIENVRDASTNFVEALSAHVSYLFAVHILVRMLAELDPFRSESRIYHTYPEYLNFSSKTIYQSFSVESGMKLKPLSVIINYLRTKLGLYKLIGNRF